MCYRSSYSSHHDKMTGGLEQLLNNANTPWTSYKCDDKQNLYVWEYSTFLRVKVMNDQPRIIIVNNYFYPKAATEPAATETIQSNNGNTIIEITVNSKNQKTVLMTNSTLATQELLLKQIGKNSKGERMRKHVGSFAQKIS